MEENQKLVDIDEYIKTRKCLYCQDITRCKNCIKLTKPGLYEFKLDEDNLYEEPRVK